MSEPPIDLVASFMDDYFAESEEHLASVRRCLLLLEPVIDGGDMPSATVEELFRSFHSMKGISAMVELREAERLAHEMETCLGAIRDRRVVLTSAAYDALVEGTNLLDHVVAARRREKRFPLSSSRSRECRPHSSPRPAIFGPHQSARPPPPKRERSGR